MVRLELDTKLCDLPAVARGVWSTEEEGGHARPVVSFQLVGQEPVALDDLSAPFRAAHAPHRESVPADIGRVVEGHLLPRLDPTQRDYPRPPHYHAVGVTRVVHEPAFGRLLRHHVPVV